jgi:Na+-transporting NADH:ubiquinone oxidoreductase subunit C
MNQFSNRYIFIFSAIMVAAVATLLSLASTLFQPAQEKNLEMEKKKSMLESIRIPANRDNTGELYDKYIKDSFIVNYKGDTVAGSDAFSIVLRNEQKKTVEEQRLPVFRAEPGRGDTVIILPVEGKGLWGPIYGFVSLSSDFNTIYGVTFDHKGETPGLGAEINTTGFEGMFTGKKLFENDSLVSIRVQKGGADVNDIHAVDAISGGTITSKGLEKMLLDCLRKYNNYLMKNRRL